MEKDKVTARIEECERLIEITKKTRDDAIIAKTTSQTTPFISVTPDWKTPETAATEIQKIDAEIEQLLSELEGSIPVDLLRELKRI